MKICILTVIFPKLSETFISNNIFSLINMGANLELWYEIDQLTELKHPNIKPIQKYANKLPSKLLSYRFIFELSSKFRYFIILKPAGLSKSMFFLLKHFNKINIQIFLRSVWLASHLSNDQHLVIYAHDSRTTSIMGIFLKFLLSKPLIISIYTYNLFAEPYLLSEKLKYADQILFQSAYSKSYALNVSSSNLQFKNKLSVIPTPGVDLSIFKKKNKYTKQNYQLVISTVARLESSKNIADTLRAVKILLKSHSVIFNIVGSGSQEKALKQQAKLLNIESSVVFHGEIPHGDRLCKIYQQTDIFILCPVIDQSGDRDMQPNVIKEAMATGTIVLTSKMGGITELISHKYNGFLTNTPTARSIVYWTKYILNLSSPEKKSVAMHAFQTIRDKHSNTDVMKHTYKSLLQYAKTKC